MLSSMSYSLKPFPSKFQDVIEGLVWIGSSVAALWPPDGCWYQATVTGMPQGCGRITVLFTDGLARSLLLHQVLYIVID